MVIYNADHRLPALLTYGFFAFSIFHNIANQVMQLQCNLDKTANYLPNTTYTQINAQLQHIAEVIGHSQRIIADRQPAQEIFSLHHTLRQILELCQPSCQQNQINCQLDCSDRWFLIGDKIIFKQIVLNLLYNSLQALESIDQDDKQIIIITKKNNNGLSLVFTDNGPGFPANFNRRTDSLESTSLLDNVRSDGHGIGLTYVKQQMKLCFSGSCQFSNLKKGAKGAMVILFFPKSRVLSNYSWVPIKS